MRGSGQGFDIFGAELGLGQIEAGKVRPGSGLAQGLAQVLAAQVEPGGGGGGEGQEFRQASRRQRIVGKRHVQQAITCRQGFSPEARLPQRLHGRGVDLGQAALLVIGPLPQVEAVALAQPGGDVGGHLLREARSQLGPRLNPPAQQPDFGVGKGLARGRHVLQVGSRQAYPAHDFAAQGVACLPEEAFFTPFLHACQAAHVQVAVGGLGVMAAAALGREHRLDQLGKDLQGIFVEGWRQGGCRSFCADGPQPVRRGLQEVTLPMGEQAPQVAGGSRKAHG